MTVPYYQDENVTIYHGDCREIIPELTFDVVVTDPPYGISDEPQKGKDRTGKRKAQSNTWHPASEWDKELPDVSILPPMLTALFGHWRKRPEIEQLMSAPIRAEIVWAKDCHVGPPCPVAMRDERIWIFSPEGVKPTRFETSVWDEQIIPTWGHKHHKNEKPINLMIRLVSWLSEAGVVLDPFMGSGTTLRAAKDLGRHAIGIELDEQYCEIAAKRMGQGVLDFGA
jgi:site-specific DNA-methyltransferase (adenine-specific)